MIARLQLQQFRAFERLDLELPRMMLLVGPNGSGKSTVLEALDCVGRLGSMAAVSVFTGPRAPHVLRRAGQSESTILKAFLADDPGPSSVEVVIPPGPVSKVELELRWNGAEIKPTPDTLWREQLPGLADQLAATSLLRLDPRVLATPSYSDDLVPTLGSDGQGLATVLAHLRLRRSADYDAIVASLREIVPSARDVAIDRARVVVESREALGVDGGAVTALIPREVTGESITVTTTSGRELPAHAISEGTLLTLGLLATIRGPRRPRLLLIDDLERGLHPKALGELVRQLRTLMSLPDLNHLQIIATTHSPYLVDHFDIREVFATALTEDGVAKAAPLANHPRWQHWKDEMLPGEFWSNVGERWIVDKAAAE